MKARTIMLLRCALWVFACHGLEAGQTLISGVPNYDQDVFPIDRTYATIERGDCVPVACTMLHGYYDANSWPRLIPYGGNTVSQNAWGIDTVVRKYKTQLNYAPENGVYFSSWSVFMGNPLGNGIVAVTKFFEPSSSFTREDDDLTSWARIQSYLNANRPCVLVDWPRGAIDSYKWDGSSTLNELGGGHAVCAVGWSDAGGRWVMCNIGWSYTTRAWFNYDGGDDWYISQVTPGGSSSGEDDDAYEDNDTIGAARTISTGTISNLRCLDTLISGSGYGTSWGDWFKVMASSGQSLSVTIAFTHASGDLDLRVFNPSEAEAGSSTGSANSESVSISSTTAGSYYVLVYGYENAKNQNYSMTVSLSSAPTIPTVQTLSGADVTTTSARLRGQVTSTGGASTLERRFEWAKSAGGWSTGVPEADYGVVEEASITGSDSEFNAVLAGLSPGTGYKYRVYARNSAGWSDVNVVNVVTFTTSASPTRVISLSGDLAFGHVAVGSSGQRTLTIANNGNSTLTVSSISYPIGFSGNWSSGTIPSGGSHNVTVTFSPSSATSYDSTVTVNSDKTSGVNTIATSGAGTSVPVSRVISVSGDLSFGKVAVGSSAQRTLTIANYGNGTLTVSSINYPSGFTGNWSSGTIPASGSQNVTVTFSPTSETSHSGNLTVNSDATSGSGNMAISGIGEGGTNPDPPYEAKWALPLNTFRVYSSAPAQGGGMVLFGTFTGTITAGGQSLTANGTLSDFYGVKLSASNQVVWVRQYGGPNEESVESCTQYPDGGWAIAGTFRDTGNIGGVSLVSIGNRDAYLARLDEAGNVLWAKQGGGSSIDYGGFSGVDGAGNCFLFGKFTTSATFTGGGVTLTATGTRFDIFAAKYSPSGDFLWAKSGGGPEYDDLYCGKVDTAGNAYLGGIFEIQTTFGPYTVVNSGSSSDWDGFLTKLNSNGDVLWLKKFGQSSTASSTDAVNFVAPAADGTCFFGGQYERAMLVDGQALTDQTSMFTAFVGKIGTSGTVEWLRGIPTAAMPEIGVYFSLSRAGRGSPMPDGGLIVGGTYKGKLAFGSTASTNTSSQEYLYFAKFNPIGTAQWAISSDSPGFGLVHFFGSAGGERVRFAARIGQPVSLPGISTITATSDDTVLVELGAPEIVFSPLIGMGLAGDKIVLAWPATATGFTLEWATTLPPTEWTSNAVVPTVVGGNLTVTNPVSDGMRFFRLRK